MVLPENENMGKGGYGGHASNQTPAIIESPVIYKYSTPTNADRMRKWSNDEIAEFTIGIVESTYELLTGEKMPTDIREKMKAEWIRWLQEEDE